MSRQLPTKPNLEHLKSQAKDLFDAHRRGEPEAFTRIRAAVPAFAHMSDEALARAPFALHDAQSAIAREYGVASWAELRAQVSAANDEPAAAAPSDDRLSAARAAAIAQLVSSAKLPPEADAALREALARREARRGTSVTAPTPGTVPVLPLRNAVAFPGAVIPIDLTRPTTLRALDAAVATEPAFVAIFAQRAAETESPSRDDLHTPGCLCVVLFFHHGDGKGWALIEGVRWVSLESLDQVDPYYAARVADTSIERGPEDQLAALDAQLRDVARRFAATLPQIREMALTLIDKTTDAGQLADLVMANFLSSVADSASYAAETDLVRRLQRAIAVLEDQLARTSAAPPPG
jgi:Lon protease-like protein